MVGTSYLAAIYLKNKNFKGKVYVIGSKAVCQELDEAGIQHTGVGVGNILREYTFRNDLCKVCGQINFKPEIALLIQYYVGTGDVDRLQTLDSGPFGCYTGPESRVCNRSTAPLCIVAMTWKVFVF